MVDFKFFFTGRYRCSFLELYTVDSGDHFEAAVGVPVTISKPNVNLL
jgi:hypothetical protein